MGNLFTFCIFFTADLEDMINSPPISLKKYTYKMHMIAPIPILVVVQTKITGDHSQLIKKALTCLVVYDTSPFDVEQRRKVLFDCFDGYSGIKEPVLCPEWCNYCPLAMIG